MTGIVTKLIRKVPHCQGREIAISDVSEGHRQSDKTQPVTVYFLFSILMESDDDVLTHFTQRCVVRDTDLFVSSVLTFSKETSSLLAGYYHTISLT